MINIVFLSFYQTTIQDLYESILYLLPCLESTFYA